MPRKTRRRLLRRALLRPTLSAAVLFVLYFTVPMDRAFRPLTVVALFGCLAIFAGLIAYQARVTIRSPYPALTAITALAFSIPLFVLMFATVYFLMEHSQAPAFTQPMTRLDALYFTVTVLATVGFGDIAPHSELARTLTMVQMVGDLVLIGLVVRVLLKAVETGRARTRDTSVSDPPEPTETDTYS